MTKLKAIILCFFLSVTLLYGGDFDKSVQRTLNVTVNAFEYVLNPFLANYASEAQILNALYEGLFSYHPQTLEPVPCLAESYKISRNKLTWTFNLRDGIKFSNGKPVTSHDIKRSWLTVLSPETDAPFASLLDCIEGATLYRTGQAEADKVGIIAKDDKTLVVRLVSPTGHFSKLLCHHSFSAVSEEMNVYSGAFVLESCSPEKIVLKKNPEYWNAENVAIPGVNIILSGDEEQNTFNFNAGLTDWVDGTVQAENILDKSALALGTQFGTEYLFFKSEKSPWNTDDARNALLYAIPWEELRKNHLVPADTFMIALRGYPDVNGIADTDLDYAVSLLEKANLKKNGVLPPVKIAISDTKYSREMTEILDKAFEKIGVTLEVQKTPLNRYLDSIANWDADIFTYSWIGDFADPLAFLELFRGNSSLNVTAWKNDKYDSILKEAACLTDEQKRYEKLAEAEQILLDSGEIIPVSHPVSFNVVDFTSVCGWFDNALDIHPFKYIYFKETEQTLLIVKAD
jgi:oligopeptide transport system substrate-binding protein